MREENKYTLHVNKKRIPVTREVYKAYYQLKEHEAYLDKRSIKYEISIEEYVEKGVQVDYILSNSQESIEDKLIRKEIFLKVAEAIEKLSGKERLLIYTLFFKGVSENKYAQSIGVTKQAVNKQKYRILKKLKKFLEN